MLALTAPHRLLPHWAHGWGLTSQQQQPGILPPAPGYLEPKCCRQKAKPTPLPIWWVATPPAEE
eukprot:1071820-Heterocapsa_arctica.AAC.1